MNRLFMIILLLFTSEAAAAGLTVHVEGVTNERGFIRLAVHQTLKSYQSDNDDKAFRLAMTEARTPGVILHIPSLPPGSYAIKVFHDENSDGILNRNYFGVPTEPYGISNNVRARFSLPPFDTALIKVHESATETTIKLTGQ